MTKTQREMLKYSFGHATIRDFPFEEYPDFFNTNINAGEYAWKPVIIDKVLSEFKDIVIWLDAGCKLVDNLDRFRNSVVENGIHSPRSPGTLGKWTHPTTLQVMGVSSNDPALEYRILSAGVFGALYSFPNIPKLVSDWSTCAQQKKCIAPKGATLISTAYLCCSASSPPPPPPPPPPPSCSSFYFFLFFFFFCFTKIQLVLTLAGSSRKNHRQDQSALSILAHRFGYSEFIDIRDATYNKMLKHHQKKKAPTKDEESCF
jgi:hypothetical protein